MPSPADCRLSQNWQFCAVGDCSRDSPTGGKHFFQEMRGKNFTPSVSAFFTHPSQAKLADKKVILPRSESRTISGPCPNTLSRRSDSSGDPVENPPTGSRRGKTELNWETAPTATG